MVPAARGLYGVSAVVEAGRVRKFRRITPTDHLLAPRGALAQSLESLPGPKAAAFAPVVMAILDPCYPVRLEQAQKRERAYA